MQKRLSKGDATVRLASSGWGVGASKGSLGVVQGCLPGKRDPEMNPRFFCNRVDSANAVPSLTPAPGGATAEHATGSVPGSVPTPVGSTLWRATPNKQ